MVLPGLLEPRRCYAINPQCFHPRVSDISRVRRARHAAAAAWHGTPVARREKLPLLQREECQFIEPDEKKLRALISVDVVLIPAVPEARRRTVSPGNYVLRFVVLIVELPRHVASKVRESDDS